MYTVDANGKKKKLSAESFRGPSETTQRRRAPVRENYGSDKKKCPTWLYWVLGAVAIVILFLLIWWLTKKGRKRQSMASGGAMQKFGFRFY
jgi:cobalamin biosynthesis Mg chelatase CobN